MSYADAVGYAQMETRKPRNPPTVGYDVYLADLFHEEGTKPTPLATITPNKNHQFIASILGIFDNLNITKNVNIPRYAIPKSILRSSHSHGGSILSWSRSLIH